MEKVIRPEIVVRYNQREVTKDLLPLITSFEYVDHVEGESDTVALSISDPDYRFLGSWYPEKGDTLEVLFGYAGDLAPAGIFEIDQQAVSGPPNAVELKGIAASYGRSMRTRRSSAHEDSSLLKIAQSIADAAGLNIVGDISPNLLVRRSTQNRETDLGYLRRIAKGFGYAFSVRGSDLVFFTYKGLEGLPPKRVVSLRDVISFSFKDKTAEVYKGAAVRYHNPDTQETINYETNELAQDTSDTLEVREIAKDEAEAQAKARSALRRANTTKTTGSLVVIGDTSLLAGNNIELAGAGVLSGMYHITKSRHSITPSGGYQTTVEVKKVK